MIKNIIFDIGMVLVDFRFRDYMTEIGLKEDEMQYLAKNMVLAPEWNYLDEGMEEDEFIELMHKKLPDYTEQVDLFFKDYSNTVKSFDYALPMIEKLHEMGYKVYLLSNYPKKMFGIHTKTSFSFIDAVDGKIISAYAKCRKPFPEIYNLLLDTYGLKAEECIFFDDKEENIKGAQAVGIKGVVFKGPEDVWASIS